MEPGELAHERCEASRSWSQEPSMYTWVRINVLIPKHTYLACHCIICFVAPIPIPTLHACVDMQSIARLSI